MVKQQAETAVIFIHIPKTAGTTLIEILERHYPSSHRYHLGSLVQKAIAEFKSFNEERRQNIHLLYGHMAYGLHDYFPQGATYFTILRHPVERVLSFYYFVRRNQQHYLHDFSHHKVPDLTAFVRSGETIMTDNFQVRFLSGIWDKVPFGGMTQEHLALAKKNLDEEVAVVGLTEQFDETLLLLKDAFGWPNVWYRSRNVTRNRPRPDAISPETIQAIAGQNHLDMALYEYGQTLFAQRLAAKGSFFKLRVWWLRLSNRPLYLIWHGQRYLRRRAGAVLSRAFPTRVTT